LKIPTFPSSYPSESLKLQSSAGNTKNTLPSLVPTQVAFLNQPTNPPIVKVSNLPTILSPSDYPSIGVTVPPSLQPTILVTILSLKLTSATSAALGAASAGAASASASASASSSSSDQNVGSKNNKARTPMRNAFKGYESNLINRTSKTLNAAKSSKHRLVAHATQNVHSHNSNKWVSKRGNKMSNKRSNTFNRNEQQQKLDLVDICSEMIVDHEEENDTKNHTGIIEVAYKTNKVSDVYEDDQGNFFSLIA